MIIDVRCRPPLREFREYFDIPRLTWHGRRTGAREVSRAFAEGSMELFFEEMKTAGIDVAVVQGRMLTAQGWIVPLGDVPEWVWAWVPGWLPCAAYRCIGVALRTG